MPSKRGGASAPRECKTQLRRCMVSDVRSGGSLRAIARTCMEDFNKCRSKGKRRRTAKKKAAKRRRKR